MCFSCTYLIDNSILSLPKYVCSEVMLSPYFTTTGEIRLWVDNLSHYRHFNGDMKDKHTYPAEIIESLDRVLTQRGLVYVPFAATSVTIDEEFDIELVFTLKKILEHSDSFSAFSLVDFTNFVVFAFTNEKDAVLLQLINDFK